MNFLIKSWENSIEQHLLVNKNFYQNCVAPYLIM